MSSSSGSEDTPWIQWFLSLKGHELLCEVHRAYIEDSFNLYGLRQIIPHYAACLDVILDRGDTESEMEEKLQIDTFNLYGLIHSRYIVTARGQETMLRKYNCGEFGRCPLVGCAGQMVVPAGMSDLPGESSVKLYCPRCSQLIERPRGNTASGLADFDGAWIGTTFPHLFFMTFRDLVPASGPATYVPRVFGYRVHKSALTQQGQEEGGREPGEEQEHASYHRG